MTTSQMRYLANAVQSQPVLTGAGYARSMSYRSAAAPQKRSHWKIKCLFVVMLGLMLTGHSIWSKHVSAQRLAAQQAAVAALHVAETKRATFDSQVTALMATDPGDTMSVVTASNALPIETLGSTAPFDGASTGKLLTAADYLTQVQNHTASLSKIIAGKTAQSWLKKMIVNSDNTAWQNLNDYLTHANLSKYAKSINFTDYDPSLNTFTSTDMARLLQDLYTGKLLQPTERDTLLNYMQQANYRQYIVAAVPAGYTVYHKIGFDDDELNDVAIITKDDKYVVLAIYTNGNGRYDQAARTTMMQQITTAAINAYL